MKVTIFDRTFIYQRSSRVIKSHHDWNFTLNELKWICSDIAKNWYQIVKKPGYNFRRPETQIIEYLPRTSPKQTNSGSKNLKEPQRTSALRSRGHKVKFFLQHQPNPLFVQWVSIKPLVFLPNGSLFLSPLPPHSFLNQVLRNRFHTNTQTHRTQHLSFSFLFYF